MFSGQDRGLNRKPGRNETHGPTGEQMASIAGVKLPDEIHKCIALADNALLFYTEHTLWYSEGVREPLSQPTMEQCALKDMFKNQLKVLVR